MDCGVIYATDAFSAGLTVVDEATAEMCGQVIYPRRRHEKQRQSRCCQGLPGLPVDR